MREKKFSIIYKCYKFQNLQGKNYPNFKNLLNNETKLIHKVPNL